MDYSTLGFPCPSPSPRGYSNSCPLSWWWCSTILSSVDSCLQSFPASGTFPMSQFFASGGQSIAVSASTSFLSMNTQDWSPLGWIGWISLQSKGLSRIFSKHHSSKASIFQCSAFFVVQLSHPNMTTGKTIALTKWTLVGKVMFLLFNMLSRFTVKMLTCFLLVIFFPCPCMFSWLSSDYIWKYKLSLLAAFYLKCVPITLQLFQRCGFG